MGRRWLTLYNTLSAKVENTLSAKVENTLLAKVENTLSAKVENTLWAKVENTLSAKGRPQEKNTELFGNFSQHRGGGVSSFPKLLLS